MERIERTKRRAGWTLAALGAAALAATAAPRPAEACGGFFCNNSAPVNQSAERIVFAKEADGTVTAIIEVMYEGPSESFAWLLPVEGSPEVGVSSTTALDRLQRATNPRYTLTVRVEGECDELDFVGTPGPREDAVFDGGVASGGGGGSEVTVIDQGSVGPYDYVVISVSDPDGDQVRVAVEWLQDNGYDVTEAQAARLRPYLQAGQNLIAFRLTKGASTGSIRPIRLTFGTGLPAIPIRPTAVAANDDMGVLVWVLGPARAFPVNYRSLVLNDALIDWFNPSRNYNDVVTAAADEAGGQGFVTEYAGDPSEQSAASGGGAAQSVVDQIFSEGERSAWEQIKAQGAELTERPEIGWLVERFVRRFARWDGTRDLLARTLDLSDEELDEFLACPGCVTSFGDGSWFAERLREGVTGASFLEDAEDLVIGPVEQFVAEVREHPWMTRLYTTMSPEEMTLDPMFDFSDRLPAVSNVHTAEQVIECAPGYTQGTAPWRIVLPSGQVVRGEGGRTWPFDGPAEADMPANLLVERVGADGSEVVVDNRTRVRERLAAHNSQVAARTAGMAGGGGGCSLGGAPRTGSLALLLVGLLGLALRRRRR